MRRLFGVFLVSLFFLPITLSHADTIRTHDGREIKGIVVEDYKDRMVISTVDGEMTLMKAQIHELSFDSEDDNLVKLAEQARENKDYARSYGLYEMALKANPNSRAAKDGVVFLQGYMFRKDEVRKADDISRQEALEKYGNAASAEKSEEDRYRESAERLKSVLGVTLEISENMPEVRSVKAGSPAADAGLRKGDRIISVWGRLTGYMPLENVVAVLMDKPSLEIKCGIARTVVVGIRPGIRALRSAADLIGAGFSMEFDGLTVSEVKEDGQAAAAGVMAGDLVTAIDGSSTRYMPLKKALEHIKNTKNDFIKLTIQREIIIWRKS